MHLELRENHAFDPSIQDTWEQAGLDIKAAGRWRDPMDAGPPRALRAAPSPVSSFRCPTLLGELTIPDDFPSAAFEGAYLQAISDVVHVQQFVGSWMGMAYRFKACTDNADSFAQLVAAHGSNVSTDLRFAQDREMFEFHVNGLSAFECLFYAMYFTAELVLPAHFPVDDPQKITPHTTIGLFDTHFPGERLTNALRDIVYTEDYDDWAHLRNILAHRIASGRTVTLTMAGSTQHVPPARWHAAIPSPPPRKPHKIPHAPRTLAPLVIEETGLLPRRKWLATHFEVVLSAAHEFIAQRV